LALRKAADRGNHESVVPDGKKNKIDTRLISSQLQNKRHQILRWTMVEWRISRAGVDGILAIIFSSENLTDDFFSLSATAGTPLRGLGTLGKF